MNQVLAEVHLIFREIKEKKEIGLETDI